MSTSFPPLPLSRRELLQAGGASMAGSSAWSAEAPGAASTGASGANTGGGAAPPSSPVQLKVNGSTHHLTLDNRTTLLDALREHLHLTGTKKGCDHGQCGACTVLLNGRRINACLTLAVMHQGDSVTTIEGLGTPRKLHPLQAAFVRHDGFQCGYCTPGQICSAVGAMAELKSGVPSHVSADLNAQPVYSVDEMRERMSGNICRCGAYSNIQEAIAEVATGSTT